MAGKWYRAALARPRDEGGHAAEESLALMRRILKTVEA